MLLYRRVVSVDNPGLYFMGFIQPLGPIMPIAETQAEWVADLLTGKAVLPPRRRCGGRSPITSAGWRSASSASKRHTIEVDFHPYLRQIRQERKRAPEAV